MCDYSLHAVASRPAKVGDQLITTTFPNTITRGFAPVGELQMSVCVLPGTEIAFENDVRCDRAFGFLPARTLSTRVARFRQIDSQTHHDALEFPGGEVVLLTELCPGQRATVLQLPAVPHAAPAQGTTAEETRPVPVDELPVI